MSLSTEILWEILKLFDKKKLENMQESIECAILYRMGKNENEMEVDYIQEYIKYSRLLRIMIIEKEIDELYGQLATSDKQDLILDEIANKEDAIISICNL